MLVVRIKGSKELVGYFDLNEDQHDTLREMLDEWCDPSYCEFASLENFGLVSHESGVPFPPVIDGRYIPPRLSHCSSLDDEIEALEDDALWTAFVDGWIYLIRCGEHVKIGYSMTPKSRIKALTTANPLPIHTLAILPGDRTDEARWHQEFSDLRVKGEWFRLDGPLLEYLKVTARKALEESNNA